VLRTQLQDTRAPRRHLRRGLATGETIIILVAATMLGVASYFVAPSAIQAMTDRLPPDQPPQSPKLLITFNTIKAFFESVHQVVQIHEQPAGGPTEVVIWQRDIDLDGQIDPSELIVLTHSSFLGQISASGVEWQPSPGDRDFSRLIAPVPLETASHPEFPSLWRARPDVSQRPIAVGIDGFRLERLGGKFGADTYRVSLRWSPDVSDIQEVTTSSFVVRIGASR